MWAPAKANKILGIIWQSFDFMKAALFLQLYNSLVHPALEYGHCMAAAPQDTLQGVRRCPALCHYLPQAYKKTKTKKEYPDRLAALNHQGLEHRQKQGDMNDLY